MRTIDDLRGYQWRLAERLFWDFGQKPGVLLSVDMGLGKTVTTATAIRWFLDCFLVRRVLIVAPLRVAQKTWPDEFEGWEHLRPLHWKCLVGKVGQKPTAQQRARWLREFLDDPKSEIAIINRENVVWLYRQLQAWNEPWPFDLLVYDESSRLKEGRKRTAGKNLSEFGVWTKVRKEMQFVIELTGTPTPKGLIDLWGQISLIDLGSRLGTTKTAFLRRWFTSVQVGQHVGAVKWSPMPHAEDEIMGRVSDLMVSMRAEDYLELPPVVKNEVYVDLTAKEMADYKRFKKTLALEEHDIEAVNQGVLTNKLLQYANGSVYRQDPNDPDAPRELVHIHDHKLAALESIVEETNGANLLVGWSFKFDRDRIRKRFPWARSADEEGVLDDWNAGKVRMLLTHPASIGHGMNVQFGGHHLVWFGLNSSLELYQQLSARLHRSGQPADRVYIHHILTRGTFDERLVEVLGERDATQERITDTTRWVLDAN